MKVQTYEQVFGKPLTIRDLFNGFKEDTKTGKVVAFDGKLNIRPPYQREFIYEITKQKEVVDTVMKGYPLNVMYWAKNGDMYELMDGQQRTMSLMKYATGAITVDVSIAGKNVTQSIHTLNSEKEDNFWNYTITVYICDGEEAEKMEWFRIINIAGLKLTEQEMRNAVYNGTWVTNANS